jgi:hypothetical protein
MKLSPNFYVEINNAAKFKHKQIVSGDHFISKKLNGKQRIVSVLSDGLGSGIKASVLSTLTSSMIMEYASADSDLAKAAVTIMKTLPVDAVRKISYSTFSIVDITKAGMCRIMEYDNPEYILIRNNEVIKPEKEKITGKLEAERDYELLFSNFELQNEDRLIVFSDGVSQSGIGTPKFPFGWGNEAIEEFVQFLLKNEKDISARHLATEIVEHAYANSNYKAKDDITCAVFYIRQPRKLLIVTGPPVAQENDKILSSKIKNYVGKTAICGGTTTKIISRELNREVKVDIDTLDPEIPCSSKMAGIDLVTEGMLTLGKVMDMLEKDLPKAEMEKNNGASKLLELILESDEIEFLVGTKINEVHQDPHMPFELGIRRNTIKSLARILDENYLKNIKIDYI